MVYSTYIPNTYMASLRSIEQIVMDYYDLVLGTIPASLLGGTGMLGALGLDLWTAVSLAAVVALAIILHALFVRAPGQEAPPRYPPSNAGSTPSSHPAD